MLSLLVVILLPLLIMLYLVTAAAHESHRTPKVFHAERMRQCHRPNDTTRILVFQCGAYNKLPESAKLSIANTKAYCKRWNYEYRYVDHPLDEMPPYWLKAYDLRRFLHDDARYDYIMYLDLDAIFARHDISITAFIDYVGDYDIYIGEDPIPPPIGATISNAGAFLFKNNDYSRQFVNKWFKTCFNDNVENSCGWKLDKVANSWSCKKCVWAGEQYEQGAFDKLFSLDNNDHIALLEYRFLSNMYEKVDSFILHLMDHDEETRYDIFNRNPRKHEHCTLLDFIAKHGMNKTREIFFSALRK